jgi:hypothetical protein
MIDKGQRGPLLNCDVYGSSGAGVLIKHLFADGSAYMKRVVHDNSEEVLVPDEGIMLGEGEYITIGLECAKIGVSNRARCLEWGTPISLVGPSSSRLENIVLFTDNIWAVADGMKLLLVDRRTGKGEVVNTPIESWRLIFEVSDELVVCWEAREEQYNDKSVVYRQGVFEHGDVLWVASRKQPTVWFPISIDDITCTSGVESSFIGSYVLSVADNQLFLAPAIGEDYLRSAKPVPGSTHVVTFDRNDLSKYSRCEQAGLVSQIGTRGHRETASVASH